MTVATMMRSGGALASLRVKRRWLVWRFVDGRKVPFSALTGKNASSTNPATWARYSEAQRAYQRGGYDGIGFVLGDGYAGIDLDKCIDLTTGEVAKWAEDIISAVGSYAEVSPSGTGVKIIGTITRPPKGKRCKFKRSDGGVVELYHEGRYFTVTRNPYNDPPLSVGDITEPYNELHDRLSAEHGGDGAEDGDALPPVIPNDLSDEQIKANIRRSYGALWDGDTSGNNGDHSSADFLLCTRLAFWCGRDPQRMDRLFRQSGLMRKKWDKVHHADGRTYGQGTIEKAIRGTDTVYGQPGAAWQPFPLDTLPRSVRELCEQGALSLNIDPAFFALPALGVMGGLIGATRVARVKPGHDEPSVIWSMLIAKSGAGKSPALRLILEPVREAQRMAYAEHDLAMAEYRQALEEHKEDDATEVPTPPRKVRYLVSDVTPEALATALQDNPRGLLVDKDEASGWFGSFGRYSNAAGAEAAMWLELHNAGRLDIQRKSGDTYVPRAAVSFVGGIQPQVFKRAVEGANTESGMAARFLLAFPPLSPLLVTDHVIPDAVTQRYAALVHRLLRLKLDEHGRPVVIPLSPEAFRVYQQWCNASGVAERVVEAAPSLSAALSKLKGYAVRFALLFHCSEKGGTGSIDAPTMQRATKLATWFMDEAERLYGSLLLGDREDDTHDLIEWIRGRGGFVTPRQLTQNRRAYRAQGKAKERLGKLAEDGWGELRRVDGEYGFALGDGEGKE